MIISMGSRHRLWVKLLLSHRPKLKIDWNEIVWTNEETLSKQHENVDNTRTAYALILGCMLNKQNRSIKYQFCLKIFSLLICNVPEPNGRIRLLLGLNLIDQKELDQSWKSIQNLPRPTLVEFFSSTKLKLIFSTYISENKNTEMCQLFWEKREERPQKCETATENRNFFVKRVRSHWGEVTSVFEKIENWCRPESGLHVYHSEQRIRDPRWGRVEVHCR